jgi:5'-3' exonuclease
MQLSRCVEYLETLPVSIISIDNVEADDVIAYTTKQLLTDSKIIIMSTDKDFLQLVDDRISVWSPTKKKLYNPDTLKEEYNVPAHNLLMCRIFDGDQSDNIKGVMGLGSKTLLKNLPDMRDDDVVYTVDDIIKKSDKNNNRFGKIVHEQQDIMHRNYKLMQLNNVDISGSAKLKINKIVNGRIQELVKPVFQKQFIEDRMFGALPNLDSWLMLIWTKLNRLAKINNNGP